MFVPCCFAPCCCDDGPVDEKISQTSALVGDVDQLLSAAICEMPGL